MPEQHTAVAVREHPAVRAWSALAARWGPPTGLTVLKDTSKSGVYRLEGAGPGGTNLIAKRCRPTTAAVERVVYEKVLPRLPVPGLRCHGWVAGPEADWDWLFVEDAAGEEYSPLSEDHRVAAARWLGQWHLAAAHAGRPPGLPERGPVAYLEHLRGACVRIRENLANPVLGAQDRAVLTTLVEGCRLLAPRWPRVQACCAGLPATVVHGDFVEKNLRVRRGPAGLVVLPLDWEMAGWGIPAADVAECGDLDTYQAVVRPCWPQLAGADLRRLAGVGRICRWLAAVDWASWGLAGAWVHRSLRSMHCYAQALPDLLAAGWWKD